MWTSGPSPLLFFFLILFNVLLAHRMIKAASCTGFMRITSQVLISPWQQMRNEFHARRLVSACLSRSCVLSSPCSWPDNVFRLASRWTWWSLWQKVFKIIRWTWANEDALIWASGRAAITSDFIWSCNSESKPISTIRSSQVFKEKCKTFDRSTFSYVRNCCFSRLYVVANWILGGVGLFVKQRKTSHGVALGFRKLWWPFFRSFKLCSDSAACVTADLLLKNLLFCSEGSDLSFSFTQTASNSWREKSLAGCGRSGGLYASGKETKMLGKSLLHQALFKQISSQSLMTVVCLHSSLFILSAAQQFYIHHHVASCPPQPRCPDLGANLVCCDWSQPRWASHQKQQQLVPDISPRAVDMLSNVCVCVVYVNVCLSASQPSWGEPPRGNPASVATRLPIRAWPMSESTERSNVA